MMDDTDAITREEMDSIRDVWRRRAQSAQQEAIAAKADLAAMTALCRDLEAWIIGGYCGEDVTDNDVDTIRAKHPRAAAILAREE